MGGFAALARLDGVAAAALNGFNFGGVDPHAELATIGASCSESHPADWPLAQLA